MANKNLSFKRLWLFVVIAILLFPSTMLVAEISEAELLNLLSKKDLTFNTPGYKTSFQMAKQANLFDPNQGMVFMDCEVTWITDGTFAMKIKYYYEHPPVFVQLGSGDYRPPDYDEEGNLIVWRSLEKYIVFAPDRNETIEKIKSFFVDPNGKLVNKGGTQTILHRYPPGDRGYTFEFNQFQLATGRGISRRLGAVMSVKSLSSDLIKATAKGSYGSGIPLGTWELTLDPNSDYLVRRATFTPVGADRPTVAVTSSGIMMKDGLKIAKYGTFKFSNLLELSVQVTGISKVLGPNKLYEEVLSHLNSPLPPGSDITDFRGKKPVITTVE